MQILYYEKQCIVQFKIVAHKTQGILIMCILIDDILPPISWSLRQSNENSYKELNICQGWDCWSLLRFISRLLTKGPFYGHRGAEQSTISGNGVGRVMLYKHWCNFNFLYNGLIASHPYGQRQSAELHKFCVDLDLSLSFEDNLVVIIYLNLRCLNCSCLSSFIFNFFFNLSLFIFFMNLLSFLIMSKPFFTTYYIVLVYNLV